MNDQRTVGRRKPPLDGLKAGFALQELALAFHKAFGNHWAPKGVYRFKSHEEADQWTYKVLANSQRSKDV